MGDSYHIDRIIKSRHILPVDYMSQGESDTNIVNFHQSVKYLYVPDDVSRVMFDVTESGVMFAHTYCLLGT